LNKDEQLQSILIDREILNSGYAGTINGRLVDVRTEPEAELMSKQGVAGALWNLFTEEIVLKGGVVDWANMKKKEIIDWRDKQK